MVVTFFLTLANRVLLTAQVICGSTSAIVECSDATCSTSEILQATRWRPKIKALLGLIELINHLISLGLTSMNPNNQFE